MTTHSNDYHQMLERLKQARVDAGLSQQEVADLLNKKQSYISKVESGERRVDIIEIKNLAEIYKKELSYFVS